MSLSVYDEDFVPVLATTPYLSERFSESAKVSRLSPPMTVQAFADAIDGITSEASRGDVGQSLKFMKYNELGCGLYVRGNTCVKVTAHHVRIWDPRQEFTIKQPHKEFLLTPHPFFAEPSTVEVLQTSENYLKCPQQQEIIDFSAQAGFTPVQPQPV